MRSVHREPEGDKGIMYILIKCLYWCIVYKKTVMTFMYYYEHRVNRASIYGTKNRHSEYEYRDTTSSIPRERWLNRWNKENG